jgi:hypothetical protein
MPPTIPAIMPENKGAPDASAMPRHSGTATRKTTRPPLISLKRVREIGSLARVFIVSINQ